MRWMSGGGSSLPPDCSASPAGARDRDRSRRPARPGRLAATVLVVGLVLLGAAAAEAQTSRILVSNTAVANDDTANTGGNDHAQLFHTGTHADGYILTGVRVNSNDDEGDDFDVEVCEEDGSADEFPSTTASDCTALTAPSDFTAGLVFFTHASLALSANTNYVVVIKQRDTGSVELKSTTNTGEDTSLGLSGWSIKDYFYWKSSGTWTNEPGTNEALRIVVTGYERVQGVTPTPTVTAVALTSDPGLDSTYGIGDAIEATVTFDAAVDIAGTPQLELDFAGTSKTAACTAATNTTTMVCAYTVAENDSAPNGIAIAANKLTLNGGTIRSTGSTTLNAVLAHSAVAIVSGHKVDGVRPTLVTTGNDAPQTSADGTQIIFTVSEDVGSVDINGIILVARQSIGSGATASFSVRTVTVTLLPVFTIQYDQTVTLSLLVAGVRDTAGNGNSSIRDQPVTNKVPQPPAVISTVEITSDPGMDSNYATSDDIEVTATFDQAVAVTGKPRIKLRLIGGTTRGDRWAEYASGSGTTALVFSYTVVATEESDTSGIEVGDPSLQADNVDLNGGTITVAATGGERLPELRAVVQRQRAPGQLGAADAVGRRDVDGRDKGAPDVQRESGRNRPGAQLVHGQGGRHGGDAERIDGYRLRQRRDADAGNGAHLGDANGDGELRRSHHRGRPRHRRGPGVQ